MRLSPSLGASDSSRALARALFAPDAIANVSPRTGQTCRPKVAQPAPLSRHAHMCAPYANSRRRCPVPGGPVRARALYRGARQPPTESSVIVAGSTAGNCGDTSERCRASGEPGPATRQIVTSDPRHVPCANSRHIDAPLSFHDLRAARRTGPPRARAPVGPRSRRRGRASMKARPLVRLHACSLRRAEPHKREKPQHQLPVRHPGGPPLLAQSLPTRARLRHTSPKLRVLRTSAYAALGRHKGNHCGVRLVGRRPVGHGGAATTPGRARAAPARRSRRAAERLGQPLELEPKCGCGRRSSTCVSGCADF